MKMAAISSLMLSAILTLPAFAAEQTGAAATSEMKVPLKQESTPTRLNPRLLPEIGMSSLQYTGAVGGDAGQAFSGGLLTELGQTKARLLETGILLLQTSSEANVGPNGSTQRVNTSQIAVPLMAKLRFIDTPAQAWYFKFGATTAFQAASNTSGTSTFDVLAGLGVGARLPMSKKFDLVAEATYNRGMIDALQAHSGVSQGLLVVLGMSFGI